MDGNKMKTFPSFPNYYPVTDNPYEGYQTCEVIRTVEEIERFRVKMYELVADLHQQMIPGIDVPEFTTGLDDLFHDTLDTSKGLAEDVLGERGR